jgi:hypothetical protein
MSADDATPTNALEGNEELVAFLHEDARKRLVPIPTTLYEKTVLAWNWEDNAGYYINNRFTRETGKTVFIRYLHEFFQQAAESYKG